MGKPLNLLGQKFGMLTVLEKSSESSKRGQFWFCKCDCGKIKQKSVMTYHLTHSKIISCGCARAFNSRTHGTPNKRLYWVWSSMKERCNNLKDKGYARYGGKGILICEEWMDFKNFYEWAINNGYVENLSIDRIDSNGNYEPSNCRWADDFTQAQNKERNHHVTYNGETKTLAEWGRQLGIKVNTLYSRLKRGQDLFAPLRDRSLNVKGTRWKHRYLQA